MHDDSNHPEHNQTVTYHMICMMICESAAKVNTELRQNKTVLDGVHVWTGPPQQSQQQLRNHDSVDNVVTSSKNKPDTFKRQYDDDDENRWSSRRINKPWSWIKRCEVAAIRTKISIWMFKFTTTAWLVYSNQRVVLNSCLWIKLLEDWLHQTSA